MNMLKKCVFILLATIISARPVFAAKNIGGMPNGKIKVRLIDAYNATTYKVELPDNTNTVVFLSNIDCNEYQMQRTFRTANGYRYIRPVGTKHFVNNRAVNYVGRFAFLRSNNVYFQALGSGVNGYPVGELYINDMNLGANLVEKGYCTYIR